MCGCVYIPVYAHAHALVPGGSLEAGSRARSAEQGQ